VNWEGWLEKWKISSLKLSAGFLELEISPAKSDRDAAWELYIELLTRVTTQRLQPEDGDEKTALDSIYSLFAITRATIRHYGRDCIEFTKLAIVVLNQVIRPFTAKWHRISNEGGFDGESTCRQFRDELATLQIFLRGYTRALADMAGVEDLTRLEEQ
jgi:hypothetical protein